MLVDAQKRQDLKRGKLPEDKLKGDDRLTSFMEELRMPELCDQLRLTLDVARVCELSELEENSENFDDDLAFVGLKRLEILRLQQGLKRFREESQTWADWQQAKEREADAKKKAMKKSFIRHGPSQSHTSNATTRSSGGNSSALRPNADPTSVTPDGFSSSAMRSLKGSLAPSCARTSMWAGDPATVYQDNRISHMSSLPRKSTYRDFSSKKSIFAPQARMTSFDD
jgi:hypothetical protein